MSIDEEEEEDQFDGNSLNANGPAFNGGGNFTSQYTFRGENKPHPPSPFNHSPDGTSAFNFNRPVSNRERRLLLPILVVVVRCELVYKCIFDVSITSKTMMFHLFLARFLYRRL